MLIRIEEFDRDQCYVRMSDRAMPYVQINHIPGFLRIFGTDENYSVSLRAATIPVGNSHDPAVILYTVSDLTQKYRLRHDIESPRNWPWNRFGLGVVQPISHQYGNTVIKGVAALGFHQFSRVEHIWEHNGYGFTDDELGLFLGHLQYQFNLNK